jgi:hypothetical protein
MPRANKEGCAQRGSSPDRLERCHPGLLLIVYMRRDYSFRFHKMCNMEQMELANGSLQCIAVVALGADDESMTVTSHVAI